MSQHAAHRQNGIRGFILRYSIDFQCLVVVVAVLAGCGPTSERAGDTGSDTDEVGGFDGGDTAGVDGSTDAGGDATSDVMSDTGMIDIGGGGAAEIVPAERPDLEWAPRSVCRLDLDCEAGLSCFAGACAAACLEDTDCADSSGCDDRGRCVSSTKGLDDTPPASDMVIAEAPPREQFIDDEATRFIVNLGLQGSVLRNTLSYRLEDSEGLFEPDRIFEVPVEGASATIELPLTGAFVRSLDSRRMSVRIRSEAGTVNLSVNASLPANGVYSAQARIGLLGSVGLPMTLEIVTDPPNVALDEAAAAWLLVPTGPSDLFAPRADGEPGDVVARPLLYDELIDRWVAVYRYDFPFGADFVVGGPESSPQRSVRIELAYESPGRVYGEFTDRWTGLFDIRSAAGVRSPSPVVFEGEFEGSLSGVARGVSELVFDVDAPARTELRPVVTLDACDDSMFPMSMGGIPQGLSFETEAGRVYRCQSAVLPSDGSTHFVVSVASFINMPAAADVDAVRAECALALAETALQGETTAADLQEFFDDDGVTPGGRSFDEFIADCAAGVDGECRPSDEVLCARQLLAYAYTAPSIEVADSDLLVDAFQRVSREAFLGRQLAAFQSDAEIRLSWLETTNFPAIVTSVLRELIGGLLTTWQQRVLDVQLEVLGLQYDSAALALLSRQTSDPSTLDARRGLLFEMSQSWRGSMDALTLAAQRWNALYVSDSDRDRASQLVAARTRTLYVLAGLAQSLNNRAGAGFANSAFASGFGGLAVESGKLSLPFSELVYARDGEVVVSRSLDPSSTNFELLGRLRNEALAAVERASVSVGAVISESTTREISAEQVRTTLKNEIDALTDELVELCGLPAGCTRADVSDDPDCAVTVEAGRCGYLLVSDALGEEEATGVNVSDVALAIGRFEAAIQNILIAQSEIEVLAERAILAQESAEAFAATVERWNDVRLESVAAVQAVIEARAGEWTGELAQLTDDIAEQNRLRGELATDAQTDVDAWSRVRVDGIEEDINSGILAGLAEASGRGVRTLTSFLADNNVLAAQALPSFAGTSTDSLTKLSRGLILATAATRSAVTTAVRVGLTGAALLVERSAGQARRYRDAELVQLAEEDVVDDLLVRNQIAELEAAVALELTAQQIAEFGVDRLIESMRARTAAELAYGRDLLELQERRQRSWLLIVDLATLQARLGEALLASEQRLLEVEQLLQRAQLLNARLAELQAQRANINSLLGSPAVVFAWANRLSQAESELDRAKSSMIDWLVAVEYYAVRPFMDQRIQILLARNTYQLADIAAEIGRLESVCGGATNAASATVSLGNLLGFEDTRIDAVDGVAYDSGEQFRAALARADVAVEQRVRLSSSLLAGDLWGDPSVWAIQFELGIRDFANLAAGCNAKILSLDVALVGEDLGEARPAVTLVHTGNSTVRSCQPELRAYVDQFGPGATAFDEITTFRTEARGISPVADVGEFSGPPSLSEGNFTLGGLPVAASYVLIIDRDAGENSDIDWDRLTDVRVRVNYTYQDFFSAGACD